MTFRNVAQRIVERSGVELHPAAEEDVSRFADLGAMGLVRDFFAQFEPSACAEIAGARLWPIAELVVENTALVPGADLHPRGFLVVGTTDCGDAYCVDLKAGGSDPPVVLYSHEEDWEAADDVQLLALRKVVARSFTEFLEAFAAGTLDREPSSSEEVG
jgi:SMI1/KNR4 family protein SUKH-1